MQVCEHVMYVCMYVCLILGMEHVNAHIVDLSMRGMFKRRGLPNS